MRQNDGAVNRLGQTDHKVDAYHANTMLGESYGTLYFDREKYPIHEVDVSGESSGCVAM